MLLLIPALLSCTAAQPPPNFEILELKGTAYERGFQHGRHFAKKIRSLYTRMLETSLMPYMDRERAAFASVLLTYLDCRYDRDFTKQILTEAGENLKSYIPQEYLDEMRGIADGAQVNPDVVLILNTFLDTLAALRAMTFFIRAQQSPRVKAVTFFGADGDGADNDGDGSIDEVNEGLQTPFHPGPHASLVEMPLDGAVQILLEDPNGVNPDLIRVQLESGVHTNSDVAVSTAVQGTNGEGLLVSFQPPGGFEPAHKYGLIISAGDAAWVIEPPPAHANMMRDVRITFTTKGYGKAPHEVENRGYDDGRSMPPSINFAVRNTATTGGSLLMGYHFSLLDINTAHKHAALFIHRPTNGKPHVVLGWTGVIFGFAGMNSDGLTYAVNLSDTLDNPFTKEFKDKLIAAKLLMSGMPIGIMGREIMAHRSSVGEAITWLKNQQPTFGWNLLLADKHRNMAAVEMDSNILADKGPYTVYSSDANDPENLDGWGRLLASTGPDDLRMASHFQKNWYDIDFEMQGFLIQPQRYWSSFYFRSLRSFYILGEEISARKGSIDVEGVKAILNTKELVDPRDSMNAAVFEPERGVVHFSLGNLPATAGPYIEFDLNAWLARGGTP